MFDFLKPDFQNTTAQKTSADRSTGFHSTVQDTGNTDALVQAVWRDIERLYKLPTGAVACKVVPAIRTEGGPGVGVQLTVMQWSVPLALHMFALQNLLRTGLDRYEPDVDHSKLSIVWQLDAHCGCPQTAIDDNIDWLGR
jgi:hypothetical protein